jgi:hypothetical protein
MAGKRASSPSASPSARRSTISRCFEMVPMMVLNGPPIL